jgi:hypothetical protein
MGTFGVFNSKVENKKYTPLGRNGDPGVYTASGAVHGDEQALD